MKNNKLQAPFPYFGGKSRIAGEVWKRFGSDVKSYVEPFCGSMAMLLGCPYDITYEHVNDIDGLLVNFWRAIQHDPGGVAKLADVPSSEIDLTARHNWVYAHKDDIISNMKKDPEYFNTKAAAYWVYVRSSLLGHRRVFQEEIGNRVPKLNRPQGIHSNFRQNNLINEFNLLSHRIRKITICSGDWRRVVTNSPLKQAGIPTAVFMDPPYQKGEYDDGVYENSESVFSEVREWCLENGDDPDLRIALCGYEGNEMPDNWTEFAWKTEGGLGKMAQENRSFSNRSRERIWFSPHCYDPTSEANTVFGSFLKEEKEEE